MCQTGIGTICIFDIAVAVTCLSREGFQVKLGSAHFLPAQERNMEREAESRATAEGEGEGEGEGEEDAPSLSASTLAALQSFLSERDAEQRAHGGEVEGEREERDAEETRADGGGSREYEMVKENWRMSQFWYDADTTRTVSDELRFLAADFGALRPIACIACPSLYVHLKKTYPDVQVRLLEYDERFRKYGADYLFYDYNHPLEIPSELHGAFHVVVADPPYLSRECLEKTAQTMKLLSNDPESSPILLLTGSVQEVNAWTLLKARPCRFQPIHTNKLGNTFLLYTNYDPQSRLGGWEREY